MIKIDKARDKVAIIAPASGVKNEQWKMDRALSFARLQDTINFFEQHDLQCVYDKEIFSVDVLQFFASSKEERIRQLKEALEDPSVKIIHAFRGGYGCLDMAFDCLEIEPSGPKILIGFSDITILHLLFNQCYNFQSIHGVMCPKEPEMLEEVIDVLGGKDVKIQLQPLRPQQQESNTRGEMIGGNLAVLCSSIGTSLHPNTDGKILFLEDIHEKDYQIHRYLVQMYNAGLFKEVKALVFGEFVESGMGSGLAIESFVNEYLPNVPVYSTNSIGHGKINRPIIMGGSGEIDGDLLTVFSPFKYI
ncbi:MAG: LD-carboxypeptidase [Rickettsiaceae bacterium]|nr:LD-carboxypeptidase [Rickettsiaceae bacterium]